MAGKRVVLLACLLTACATPPPARTEAANSHGYIWLATPRPSGDDAARSEHFQEMVAAALAARGYHQDPTGSLAIALSFTGAEDASVGPHQGGYATFIPNTGCSTRKDRPRPAFMVCMSILNLRSGNLVAPSSGPIAWDASYPSIDRALASSLGAHAQGE